MSRYMLHECEFVSRFCWDWLQYNIWRLACSDFKFVLLHEMLWEATNIQVAHITTKDRMLAQFGCDLVVPVILMTALTASTGDKDNDVMQSIRLYG